ncbi:hypothetical protein Tco_0726196 [Tanacetum coccineum]|uniref:Uncharacterized protein n=1 Tax=Tanacetum coccineum TaxID=301880 RepID=A0ABQ4YH80_9ASTR
MSSITAQQAKLDLELVPKEKRLEIGKCNGRLNLGKTQREPTFQVVLDALALTPCYSEFLTTVDVPEVYMHQFWDSIQKRDTSYRFRMDKKKKFYLNLETFKDIFQICPRVHGQDFDELPTDEVIVSFFNELGHTREIKSINDVVVDQMHQPWRTFATIINRSLSGKTSGLDKLRVTPPKKARKSNNAPTAGVVNRDTPVISLSKKKEKMTVEKRKGIKLLSKVALTEEAQYKEVRKKSLRDFYKTHPSGSGIVTKIAPSAAKIKPSVTNKGTGAKPGVLDVTEEESTDSEAESWGRDKDDSNNDHESSSEGSDQESESGDDNTQSDKEKGLDSEHGTDENETGSESDQEENKEEVKDDEEEKEDESVKTSSNYTCTDDKDETNVESKVENKGKGDEDKGMDYTTNQLDDDVDQGNENLEIILNQVIEDAHVTFSTVAKKTEVPVTSSSHLSDLASKFLNLSNILHTDAEIVSPMDVNVHHEVPSNKTLTLLTIPISVIIEYSHVYTTVIPQSLPSFTPLPPQSTPTPPPTTEATNPLSALPNFPSVFQFNNRVSALEKEVVELKNNDLLNTQVTALVDEHLHSRIGATQDEFMSYLLASITTRITKHVKIQLPQILPKEVCNFSPLVINDIEDILLLVVQNRLTNLSGDDVSDFYIALRMFTKSMVIQTRVEGLQLGVKSYQKKINVTKPKTTRPGIRKRDPYTAYQDP